MLRLVFLSVGSAVVALNLKAGLEAVAPDYAAAPAPAELNPNITSKYDDLAYVNEVLFTIACRAKHEKDVVGEARAIVTGKGLTGDEFMAQIEKIQNGNVEEMQKTCGLMASTGWQECRTGCGERWNAGNTLKGEEELGSEETEHDGASPTLKKEACVAKCEKRFGGYEATCKGHADKLAAAYTINNSNLQAGQKCGNLHCPDFPQVLMQSAQDPAKLEEKQKTAIADACANKCKNKEGDEKKQCTGDCDATWKLSDLSTCLTDLRKNVNVTTEFCHELWDFLYSTSEIDPTTGDPAIPSVKAHLLAKIQSEKAVAAAKADTNGTVAVGNL